MSLSFGNSGGGGNYAILRDGVQFGYGAATSWRRRRCGVGCHSRHFGILQTTTGWTYQPAAPSLSGGVTADLSGAATNPAGVLQIDTRTSQAISGATLSGTSITNSTLANSGTVHVTGGVASTLSDVSINNTAAGAVTIDPGSTLDLTNTTISGGSLANSGTLDAIGQSNVLNAVAVTNSGTIEATSGTLTIVGGSLANSGNLLANGGTLVISEAITGNGSATISGSNSVLDLQMASTQNVAFASGAHGILQLDNAPSYTGTIAGLVSGDAIDLTNFQFSGNPIISGITGTGAVGTPTNVTVQDAGQSVTLELLNQTANQYSTLASAYTLTSDNTLAHGSLFALHP